MSQVKKPRAEPTHLLKMLAKTKHKHYVSSGDRTDKGPGFWEMSDYPINEVATEIFRSAIRSCKPVPSVTNRSQSRVPS